MLTLRGEKALLFINQSLKVIFLKQFKSNMKTLHCRDAGFDCEGVITAGSDEEILQQASQHALDVHGVSVTPELAQQLKTLIKEGPKEEAV